MTVEMETFVGDREKGFGKLYSNITNSENGIMTIVNRTLLYQGQWKNGNREGIGIEYHYIGIPVYYGEWKANKRHGYGKQFDFNGSWTEGYWEEGKPVQETHKLVDGFAYFQLDGEWNDSLLERYQGDLKNGIPNGYGRYVCKNAAFYVGEWKKGVPNGKGTFYYPNSTITYYGEIKDGNCHGYGTFFYPDRSYYEGEWLEGEFSGFGIYVRPYGEYSFDDLDPTKSTWVPPSWYVGNWENDYPNGKGKLFIMEPNVEEVTDEEVRKAGRWEGAHMLKAMKSIDNLKTNRRFLWYEGDFKNGDPLGKGEIYDQEGRVRFSGEVKGSIQPTGLSIGTITKWSDDSNSPVNLWPDLQWRGILKLGFGSFLTKSGKVWFEGSMEGSVSANAPGF